jgi:hypothetical protein
MLTNSYNNDKYGANTTSIFVPVQYKPQVEAVIEYQNTKQGDNGEFIAAIECTFSFCNEDWMPEEAKQPDILLVTTQWGVFKRVLQEQTDPALLLAFFMDLELPQVNDDAYIRSAVQQQELGNVWYCNDWLLPVPIEVHWAADTFADENEADLLFIKPVGDLYSACYDNKETVYFGLQTKTVVTQLSAANIDD